MKALRSITIKGGVGKRPVPVHPGPYCAAKSGARTLLWDLDPQGSFQFFIFASSPLLKGDSNH